MSVNSFEELLLHAGHRVSVVTYCKLDEEDVNVSIECDTCNEVLVSFDKPHNEECICGTCTGEDKAIEAMEKGICKSERNYGDE
jgi:Zn finger protein HypA/HybF involved in hydrogenase expression